MHGTLKNFACVLRCGNKMIVHDGKDTHRMNIAFLERKMDITGNLIFNIFWLHELKINSFIE